MYKPLFLKYFVLVYKTLKIWWPRRHSFCLFNIFFLLHIFGVPEPRIKLGAALQQHDALPVGYVATLKLYIAKVPLGSGSGENFPDPATDPTGSGFGSATLLISL